MTREENAARLADIRARHAAASTDWQRGMTEAGEGLLGRLIPKGELTPIFLFDPWTDRRDIEFGLHAHADIKFLLDMFDRAAAMLRRQAKQEEAGAPFDFAQNCGVYCNKREFWNYLKEVHGLADPNKTSVETKVRTLLKVKSRSELNTDPVAAEAWIKLRSHFKAWRRI